MVKAISYGLIDRGFKSRPSHFFFIFLSQEDQKIELANQLWHKVPFYQKTCIAKYIPYIFHIEMVQCCQKLGTILHKVFFYTVFFSNVPLCHLYIKDIKSILQHLMLWYKWTGFNSHNLVTFRASGTYWAHRNLGSGFFLNYGLTYV